MAPPAPPSAPACSCRAAAPSLSPRRRPGTDDLQCHRRRGGHGGSAGNAWTLRKTGSGTLTLAAANTYSGGTTITGGFIGFSAANNFGTGQITLNGGGLLWTSGNFTDISARLAPLGSSGGVFDTNGQQ